MRPGDLPVHVNGVLHALPNVSVIPCATSCPSSELSAAVSVALERLSALAKNPKTDHETAINASACILVHARESAALEEARADDQAARCREEAMRHAEEQARADKAQKELDLKAELVAAAQQLVPLVVSRFAPSHPNLPQTKIEAKWRLLRELVASFSPSQRKAVLETLNEGQQAAFTHIIDGDDEKSHGKH